MTMVLQADTADAEVAYPSIPYHDTFKRNPNDRSAEKVPCVGLASPSAQRSFSWSRESFKSPRTSSMPVTNGSGLLIASSPPFLSGFGDGDNNTEEATEFGGATIGALSKAANINKRPLPNNHCSSPILRRDSASTYESTDSSPTTTISTMDSSLTEPSPSSSPESPQSAAPLSTFGPTFGTAKQSGSQGLDQTNRPSSAFASLPGINRGDSPNKKMRNMKNLSVNTAASSRASQQLSSLAFQPNSSTTAKAHAFSAPPTPAFIVPPKPPKKRPSNLGLKISTVDDNHTNPNLHSASGIVPSTPSMNPQFRTLDYLQSNSTALMIGSPTVAPEGGMRLPPFGSPSNGDRLGRPRPPLSMSNRSYDNNYGSPITRQTLDHVEEENDYELPLSREAKSPAYPQGPVCIYDPYVYLYLEPTDSEASQFDVILNVAREVKNPFAEAVNKAVGSEVADAAVQVELNNGDIHKTDRESLFEPQTAISDRSFSSAFETQPEDVIRTPPGKPTKIKASPEYIHILWDHNTNVVDDLLRLCEIIDDRSRKGKKVLVHCQCGVSRSASLVVAYGLYKNPLLTVQEAYDAVKSRSKWIGPNMNLIYQLSEFKSKLPKTLTVGQASWHSWRDSGRSNPNAKSPDPRLNAPTSTANDGQQSQLSASFRKDLDIHLTPARANSFSPTTSALPELKNTAGDITPGPSSAPPDMQWSPGAMASSSGGLLKSNPFEEATSATNGQKEQVGNLTLSPTNMEIDTATGPLSTTTSSEAQPESKIAPFPLKINHHLDSPVPPTPASTTPLTPSLPAGFSSLLSRRAAAPIRQLPFRQETPRSIPFQLPTSFRPDHPMSDEPPLTPSLLSPRAAEFTASPFHRTAAGDLAGSSMAEQQAASSPKPQDEDPRSPAERGGAPIVRNIFDVL